jgi:penicillin-binding protein 1A
MSTSNNIKKGKNPNNFKENFKKYAVMAEKTILAVFLICVITGSIVIGALTIYVVKVENPGALDLNSAKLNYTSIIYATDSKTGKSFVLQRLYKDENRIWVNLDVVPNNLKWAFICTEDQRFYEHEGVDWKRTISAFANLLVHLNSSSGGGSSITQQLVKNITNNKQINITRKIQEILIAVNTEKVYSKDQILECYLNKIPLGGTIYGVQTAANTYFGKDVSKLDLAECATLACITNATDYYNPLKHPDHVKIRVKYVLDNMLNQGKVTKAQYDAAIKEKDKMVYNTKPAKQANQSYFVDQIITDVTNDFMSQKGYEKADAQNIIFSQGIKIYATIDTQVQSIMDSVYTDDKYKYFQKLAGDVQPQSAMIIVDYSGKIVGMEGGRGQKTDDMALNRATKSKRQPGSSIKPLATYGPAIEWNQITYSTIFDDHAPTTKNGKPWPKDSGAYRGNMPVVTAISDSINTVAVRIMQKITPQKSYDFLTKKLGFTSVIPEDKTLALAIGALTDGVTLREMAGGFEIFGDGGKYTKPYTYTRVTDKDDNVLLENKGVPVQVIGDDTAFVMNQLLQQVVKTGTGMSAKLPNMPVAGKTGTTSDNWDRWFIGITPYYVGVTWLGYDIPKEIVINGTNPALAAWKSVMAQVVKAKIATQPNKEFPTSGKVVKETYCLVSGDLATSKCPRKAVGWYKANNPLPLCKLHPDNPVQTPSISSDSSSSQTNDSQNTD